MKISQIKDQQNYQMVSVRFAQSIHCASTKHKAVVELVADYSKKSLLKTHSKAKRSIVTSWITNQIPKE